MKRREKGQNDPRASKTEDLNCLALFRERKSTGLQVNNPLFPTMGFDSRGSLGTGGNASAWGSHCSFASQRKKKNGIYPKLGRIRLPHPFFPLPPPIALAATAPSCRKRKGGRGRRTHRSQAARWDSLSLAFTSQWGSGRYWFSFMCERVPLA